MKTENIIVDKTKVFALRIANCELKIAIFLKKLDFFMYLW